MISDPFWKDDVKREISTNYFLICYIRVDTCLLTLTYILDGNYCHVPDKLGCIHTGYICRVIGG